MYFGECSDRQIVATQATSARVQAATMRGRHVRAKPASLVRAAIAPGTHSETGHSLDNTIPDAKAGTIHNAGSFTCVGEVEPLPPYEKSVETDRTSVLRTLRSLRPEMFLGHVRALGARKKRT